MPSLNPRVTSIDLPPIMAAHAWATRYDGKYGPAIDLCQAVPGYAPLPALLAHAAAAAADPAFAKYGPIAGDPVLRAAYAAILPGVCADQVAITAGCNQAFFTTLLTIGSAGDTVLLPTPWFWNHQQSCDLLGITPRPLPCHADQGFVPAVADAERLIDASTRAIVLISPNNPTGAVTPPDTIAAFAALCRRRNIWLILDETYRDFLPAGQHQAHRLFETPGWDDHVIGLYSFSKAYCLPGHRLGAVTASAAIIGHLTKALDSLHICQNRVAQAAVTWGIAALTDWRASNRALINARAATLHSAMMTAPDWVVASSGAYFAYVRHPYRGTPSAIVAEHVTSVLGAVCLPGSAFGPDQDDYVRLAFANADADAIGDLARRLRSGPALRADRPKPACALA